MKIDPPHKVEPSIPNPDLLDEVEPPIPNSDLLKEFMEEYKKHDQEEASTALIFFLGAFTLIILGLLAIAVFGCQSIILDSDCDFLHHHQKENFKNDKDDQSYISIPTEDI